MNCLCNFFNDDIIWLIIIALVLVALCNNGCGGYQNDGGCGCGCGR